MSKPQYFVHWKTNQGCRFERALVPVALVYILSFFPLFWPSQSRVNVVEAFLIPSPQKTQDHCFTYRLHSRIVVDAQANKNDQSSGGDDQITYVKFSRAFQRHVVYRSKKSKSAHRDTESDECLESFLFLDEAIIAYPQAKFEKLSDIGVENDEDDFHLVVAGMGTIPSSKMLSERKGGDELTAEAKETLCYLASLTMVGQQGNVTPPGSDHLQRKRDLFIHKLGSDLTPRRFESHSPESIQRNYVRVMDLLTRGRRKNVKNCTENNVNCLLMDWTRCGLSCDEAEARAVIANFPQLCLYDVREIEERIKFLILPRKGVMTSLAAGPKKKTEIDYYYMMRKGEGAGLTVEQATMAIRAVPQLLSIYHEDSRKPSMLYFYRDLNVPMKEVEEARSELATLINGCDGSDLLSFVYLKSIGISWQQIKFIFDAFPIISYCETEPGWELLDNGPVRNTLDTAMLNFLRKRLQITNSDLHSMIKTHSRLTTYSAKTNLVPKLNVIQDQLALSTRELQRIVLRMPSVTGMSVQNTKGQKSALHKRLDFFINEAQMNPEQLKDSIMKQPSLLQYSVESTLRPKLEFLLRDLKIGKSEVGRIIRAAPAILGLSLENNLCPKVATLKKRCNLTNEQIGNLVIAVPPILLLSLKQKIDVTLNFLTSELDLNSDELGNLIQSSPRILMHGVETSLFHKINSLREAYMAEGSSSSKANDFAISSIKKNPSLLVTTNAIFQSRIDKCLKQRKISLSETLKPRKSSTENNSLTQEQDQVQLSSRTHKSRAIVELRNKRVVKEFESAKVAADTFGVSTSSIYTAISNGKMVKGKLLQYRDLAKPQTNFNSQDLSFFSFDDIKASPFGLYGEKSDSVSLFAFASGCIYPKDNINTVRGKRKAGGIAIKIPQVTKRIESMDSKFQEATRMSFGMIMPESEGGTNSHEGLVLAGFPFLRPSRNRCDLYACHGALKVVLQLLKQAAEKSDMRKTDVDIIIFTDSTYAWKLLKDSDNLLEWGSAACREEALFEVNGPLSLANPDLLFPLTKTMHRMSNNAVINRKRNKRLCIGNKIRISFRYVGDLRYDRAYAKQTDELNDFAKKAAMWQFEKG